MEQRTPDGDAPEGLGVSNADQESGTVEPEPSPSLYEGVGRIARWTRTIVVEGPAEWVERTRTNSLAEGKHSIGSKKGVPCSIEVTSMGIEVIRHLDGKGIPIKNLGLAAMRRDDPAAYEAVHGPGTAAIHAAYEEPGVTAEPEPTPPPVDTHVGQYL